MPTNDLEEASKRLEGAFRDEARRGFSVYCERSDGAGEARDVASEFFQTYILCAKYAGEPARPDRHDL